MRDFFRVIVGGENWAAGGLVGEYAGLSEYSGLHGLSRAMSITGAKG